MGVSLRMFRVMAVVAGTSLAASCSATPSAEQPPAVDAENLAEESAEEPVSDEHTEGDGDGDYAFGADRDQIATAIEAPFANRGGTARWEGDTLVLTLDDDGGGPIPGFTECRVLMDLLNEDDLSVIEFPDGRVDCAELLADM